MKAWARILLWAALPWWAGCLASCSTRFPPPATARGTPPVLRHEVATRGGGGTVATDDAVDVWLVADPLHTGLVVPLDWLRESGFEVPASVRGQRYVNLSWGDRVAYEQERWLNAWEVFNALFLPSDSVMEIIGFDYDPRQVFPASRMYHDRVARDKGPGLAAFLNHCGGVEGGGKWRVVGPPTWGRGNLLESPYSYGFPRLCNAFTAGALETCGYRFGLWSEIWADALLESCVRQGFEPLPDLSPGEIRKIIEYSKAHPQ